MRPLFLGAKRSVQLGRMVPRERGIVDEIDAGEPACAIIEILPLFYAAVIFICSAPQEQTQRSGVALSSARLGCKRFHS
jgi:hypothetical protein